VFLAVAVCEAQPFLLDEMVQHRTATIVGLLSASLKTIFAILAPIAAAIAFLASKLGEIAKNVAEATEWPAWVKGVIAKIAIYFAGLVVPFLLWMFYLSITRWGLCIDQKICIGGDPDLLEKFGRTAAAWTSHSVLLLYLVVSLFLLPIALFLQPNANSLHPLIATVLGRHFSSIRRSRILAKKIS
jgi:hypothetical protein